MSVKKMIVPLFFGLLSIVLFYLNGMMPNFKQNAEMISEETRTFVPSMEEEFNQAKDKMNNIELNMVRSSAESEEMIVVDLSEVHFGFGSARLTFEAKQDLSKLRSFVTKENLIRVEGHADKVGSECTNYLLSLDRAGNVVDYLNEINPIGKNIYFLGYGENKLVEFFQGRSYKNRRVEILISKIPVKIKTKTVKVFSSLEHWAYIAAIISAIIAVLSFLFMIFRFLSEESDRK